MGTCNFHTVNAGSTYVLYDYFEEDGERYENEWAFLKEDILCFGLERGWDDSKQRSFRFCRDSDISVISKEFWFEFKTSGLKYKVEAFITMNPGYYEHCNLDYRLVLDYEEGDTPKDELLDRIVEDFTEDMGNCYISYVTGGLASKVWNRGLRNAHKKNFENEASKFINNIIEECEQMCKYMSHDTYRRVGAFSNGEGIYEKIAE